ncbi:hypothetical protein C4J88_2963 [Pseudomonas sp. R4-39-08]|uniref:DUF551 domain-containing protein n=1 Tax=Pseudomonas sp. R4-39-08 TaxID=1173288 RepID=UPI000F5719EF|nr:DUF551 domain-containing protein [Pseudomonas sp. R4-39-08]AZF37743.1 hypothetical protein C4J88_2963 [Pseudomonas sp. R4-39-08]
MNEWIACSERLPELNQVVVMLNTESWMNTGSIDWHCNWHGAGYLCEFGHQYWTIFGESRAMSLDAVTHWMPIPESPAQ